MNDATRFNCSVCGKDMGWDRPSGVCSDACIYGGQGFTERPGKVPFYAIPINGMFFFAGQYLNPNVKTGQFTYIKPSWGMEATIHDAHSTVYPAD